MIQTIINQPKVLTSNSSPIIFDVVNIITRCTPCSRGGWLDYENGSPLFNVLGKDYNGYYNANFSASISSATAGTVAIGLYKDGILLPDTVRAVTLAAAGDYETVSFNRKLQLCRCDSTSLVVGSVPSVPTPTDPTTPIVTEAPIITNAIFNLARTNN
jgi:hypothetical protein